MQRVETEAEIQISVIDETSFEDDEDWDERRENFRLKLEQEFGAQFEEANIGPSADLPAFVTFIVDNMEVIGTALLATFFYGKRIEDSWFWWISKAKLIHKFASRDIRLNRNGAAILAVEAVMREFEDTPTEINLLRYGVAHMGEADDLRSFEIEHESDGPIDTLFLGFIKHIFEIQVDSNTYRVGVDGSEVEVVKLS